MSKKYRKKCSVSLINQQGNANQYQNEIIKKTKIKIASASKDEKKKVDAHTLLVRM